MNGKLGVGSKGPIRKYPFVNRTIGDWNRLPAEVLGTLSCKTNTLKKKIRKVINELS
jgi:hypothetical protein